MSNEEFGYQKNDMSTDEHRTDKDFDKLANNRQELVEGMKKNRGFLEGLRRHISELNPEKAHFIFELLQNADDQGATFVEFFLQDKQLLFIHDGTPFSLDDIESITNINWSTKKDDPTKIGKLGVGFKAVYAYTETPKIESGGFHFRIVDQFVPQKVQNTIGSTLSIPADPKRTFFTFPLGTSHKRPSDAHDEIQSKLSEIDETSLLFLKNIRRIKYKRQSGIEGYVFCDGLEGGDQNIFRITQKHYEKEKSVKFFLKFQNHVSVLEDGENESCPDAIAVAFELEKTELENPWKIIPIEQAGRGAGKVCIFLPAINVESGLRFHVHGAFAPTKARDNIDWGRDVNKQVQDGLSKLVSNSIEEIKQRNLLTMDFLAVLPHRGELAGGKFEKVFDDLRNKFRENPLIPMKNGGYGKGKDAYRSNSKGIVDVIGDSDLTALIGNLAHGSPNTGGLNRWVAYPPKDGATKRISTFLEDMDIKKWGIEDFVKIQQDKIQNWLEGKVLDYDWHRIFYIWLDNRANDSNLVNKFKELPIVLTTNGNHRVGKDCLFYDDSIPENICSPIVNKAILLKPGEDDEDGDRGSYNKVHGFLEKIGVSECTENDEIKGILNKYSVPNADHPDYINDIQRFIDSVIRKKGDPKWFSDKYIFPIESVSPGLEGQKWGKPSEVHLDRPILEKIYNVRRINQEFLSNLPSEDEFRKFAKIVGVRDTLRITELSNDDFYLFRRINDDFQNWRMGTTEPTEHGIVKDYYIEKLSEWIREQHEVNEFVQLLWDTMMRISEECLEARYKQNKRHNAPSWDGASTLVQILRDNPWVPQENSKPAKPEDTELELLPSNLQLDKDKKWLEAVGFPIGKNANLKSKEIATKEEQEKNEEALSTLANSHGLPKDDIKRFLSVVKEANESSVFIEELCKAIIHSKKQKPEFPQDSPPNPKYRDNRIADEVPGSPQKEYELRVRNTRVSKPDFDPEPYLRERYTNSNDEMICQICEDIMPFKKIDGDYYFEAVEIFDKENMPKEHQIPHLALCPTCAAKYKEFVKRPKGQYATIKGAIARFDFSRQPENYSIRIKLDEDTEIRFTEKHLRDVQSVLRAVDD